MAATRSRSKLIWDVISYVVLIGLAFIAIAPIAWTFLTSLKFEEDIVTRTM